MPDETLCGNHDPCPACDLRREALGKVPIGFGDVPCNTCGGKGFLPLSAAEIVERTADEARRTHWPAFDERNGI